MIYQTIVFTSKLIRHKNLFVSDNGGSFIATSCNDCESAQIVLKLKEDAMQPNIIILQLIERVIDQEASLEEVEQLIHYFEQNDEYFDYFLGYKLLRDAYPKKRESDINGDQASS